MPVNPITVLKIVLQKRVDDVEGGEDGNQIVIIVAARVKGLFVGCLFGWSPRSRTFLWGMIGINVRDKTGLKLEPTINN